jgi:hypothetical protein
MKCVEIISIWLRLQIHAQPAAQLSLAYHLSRQLAPACSQSLPNYLMKLRLPLDQILPHRSTAFSWSIGELTPHLTTPGILHTIVQRMGQHNTKVITYISHTSTCESIKLWFQCRPPFRILFHHVALIYELSTSLEIIEGIGWPTTEYLTVPNNMRHHIIQKGDKLPHLVTICRRHDVGPDPCQGEWLWTNWVDDVQGGWSGWSIRHYFDAPVYELMV